MSFSFKAFKKNFWFLQLLTLKILALSLAFSLAIGLIVALGTIFFTSLGLITMSQEFVTFHFQSMFHFVPEMKWFAGWLIILVVVAIGLFLVAKLISYGFSLLSNILDIAENKEPRGLKPFANALNVIPILLVSSFCHSFYKISSTYSISIAIISITLMLMFALRLYYAFFIIIDSHVNGFQAVLQSWKLTHRKIKSLFFISLIIVIPSLINFLVQQKIIGFYSTLVYFCLMCVFNPLYLLIAARTYVLLKGERN